MNTLYYGGGNCSIEGHIGSLVIYYRGNIVIENKLPDDYKIELGKGKLIISPSSKTRSLNELFRYLGKFRIFSITANDIDGNTAEIRIKTVMDYIEQLNTKAEDLTVKSEDLKVTYIHGTTFRQTYILPRGVKAGKI